MKQTQSNNQTGLGKPLPTVNYRLTTTLFLPVAITELEVSLTNHGMALCENQIAIRLPPCSLISAITFHSEDVSKSLTPISEQDYQQKTSGKQSATFVAVSSLSHDHYLLSFGYLQKQQTATIKLNIHSLMLHYNNQFQFVFPTHPIDAVLAEHNIPLPRCNLLYQPKIIGHIKSRVTDNLSINYDIKKQHKTDQHQIYFELPFGRDLHIVCRPPERDLLTRDDYLIPTIQPRKSSEVILCNRASLHIRVIGQVLTEDHEQQSLIKALAKHFYECQCCDLISIQYDHCRINFTRPSEHKLTEIEQLIRHRFSSLVSTSSPFDGGNSNNDDLQTSNPCEHSVFLIVILAKQGVLDGASLSAISLPTETVKQTYIINAGVPLRCEIKDNFNPSIFEYCIPENIAHSVHDGIMPSLINALAQIRQTVGARSIQHKANSFLTGYQLSEHTTTYNAPENTAFTNFQQTIEEASKKHNFLNLTAKQQTRDSVYYLKINSLQGKHASDKVTLPYNGNLVPIRRSEKVNLRVSERDPSYQGLYDSVMERYVNDKGDKWQNLSVAKLQNYINRMERNISDANLLVLHLLSLADAIDPFELSEITSIQAQYNALLGPSIAQWLLIICDVCHLTLSSALAAQLIEMGQFLDEHAKADLISEFGM